MTSSLAALVWCSRPNSAWSYQRRDGGGLLPRGRGTRYPGGRGRGRRKKISGRMKLNIPQSLGDMIEDLRVSIQRIRTWHKKRMSDRFLSSGRAYFRFCFWWTVPKYIRIKTSVHQGHLLNTKKTVVVCGAQCPMCLIRDLLHWPQFLELVKQWTWRSNESSRPDYV